MTTWRSMINDCPECDADHPFYPLGYYEWLARVMAEPWVRALEDMVRWSGVWVGTEEEFFEELKMRVGKEVSSSPDFPADFERLRLYSQIARDGFNMRNLGFWHHRELTEEDLDDYDVPGWGLEAPILVYQGDAASRPDYWKTMCKLLAYGDALPLSVLIFTGNDRHFRNSRRWTGTTTELLDKLRRHDPNGLGGVPRVLANLFRPPEKHKYLPTLDFNPPNLLEPWHREDYLCFHKQMQKWATMLKEVRIKISKEKHAYSRVSPEDGKVEQQWKTFWTIEAPRWRKPDLY